MNESGIPKRLGRWVWGRGRGPTSAVAFFVVGAGVIGLSILPGEAGRDDAWTRDVLMTVGSSLALFGLFFLLTRSLERHMDEVERKVEDASAESAEQIATVRTEAAQASIDLSGEVEALRADVDQRLSDVAARVTARLEAAAAADREAFGALRHNASRAVVVEALERAHKRGLVSDLRPPRVIISEQAELYASVDFTPGDEWDDEPLRLRVESLGGGVLEWIDWPEDKEAEDALVEVGLALSKHTNETFDPGVFLGGLADLLEAALSHSDRRAAVQLCPPQWMVCDWGVVRYDGQSTYGFATSRLRKEDRLLGHVATKAWADVPSWEQAFNAAISLYPEPAPNPWASTASYDEPPF